MNRGLAVTLPEPPSPASAPVRLVILGPPRTKKNHGRRVWARAQQRAVHVPSEAYETWSAAALLQLTQAPRLPPEPYNCAALFYRDANRGDLVGYMQALADTLEAAGVVEDDKYIAAWDGSRLLKDAAAPRVEVTLSPLAT